MIIEAGQIWEETVKGVRGSVHIFLVIGHGEGSIMHREYYRLLNLETGETTVVIKPALDEAWDNKSVRWERFA